MSVIEMKAYQIKIEFVGSDPLIWRRIIMPADATFNRLHDVIQNVTNFKSGYPYEDYHLYEFDLANDNIRVTNDDEAYEEHKHFVKNRTEVENRIKESIASDPEIAKFQEIYLKGLETVIRKPVGIKIDTYIESYDEIRYTYDFGDDWKIVIRLEQIIEDYNYGYPTLIDGAETAPPEDVGGLPGYEEFLQTYHDEDHPDHQSTKSWAGEQVYREYDANNVNRMLKYIKYK